MCNLLSSNHQIENGIMQITRGEKGFCYKNAPGLSICLALHCMFNVVLLITMHSKLAGSYLFF